MVLPVNVDSTYADSGTDASVALHQQHHDTIHAAVNAAAGGSTGQVWQKTSSADYAAVWGDPKWSGGDYFRSGYYSHGLFAAGNTTGVALPAVNYMIFRPFLVPIRRAFDRIGINVTAGGTAGAVLRMGIYTDLQGKPDALIVDAGTVASTSTGAKEATISQTLDPGLYWLGIVGQVAVCSVTSYASNTIGPYTAAADTAIPPTGANSMRWIINPGGPSGALPSSASAASSNASSWPAVCLRAV